MPLSFPRFFTTSSCSSSGYPIPCIQNEDQNPTTKLSQRDAGNVDRIGYKCRRNRGGVYPMPLTMRVKFVRLGALFEIAPSSNGKTADSGSAYRGSNPCGAAHHPANHWFLRPYRLTVRTEPSQGSNTGSIPVKATRRKNEVCRRLSSRSFPAGFFSMSLFLWHMHP